MPPQDSRAAEIASKRARVVAFLVAHELDAILLQRRQTLGWLLAGARLHVRSDDSAAEGTAIVTRGGDLRLVTNRIEATRFADEEIAGLGLDLTVWPWTEDPAAWIATHLRQQGCDPGRVARETELPPPAAAALRDLRASLLPAELARYRALCRDAAQALEQAARALVPGITEHAAAASVAAAVTATGCLPAVVLVAFDGRIDRYRHPLPTPARLARRAMLVLCAERGGQVAALTRLVRFGAADAALRRRFMAVAQVDAAAIAASRPGATAAELYDRIAAAYSEVGFAGEIELHHQGGAIGYAPREWIARPGGTERLHAMQPCAWNPSITGTKSEDTILATDGGPELLTVTGEWPAIDTAVGPRPDELDLSA